MDAVVVAGQAVEPDPFVPDPDVIDRLPVHRELDSAKRPAMDETQKRELSEDLKKLLEAKVESGELIVSDKDAVVEASLAAMSSW